MTIHTATRFPRSRLALVAGVVLVLALVLGACSSSGSSKSAASSADITMKDLAFKVAGPVAAGATVSVKNNDGVTHTVTSDDGTSFNMSVDGGASTSFKAPTKPGTYKFHCNIHSQMHGSLTVQ